MAEVRRDEAQVNARVVYWGIEGSGKTTNLQTVFAKLRPDHRSELREVPTRFDPTVCYEVLPIELGEIAGMCTRIQIIAVPGSPEQAPTRKQLLDRVDGLVFVVDSQRERLDENIASFEELRQSMSAYGRALDDLPLIVQYNKRDLADPYALEELHRKLGPGPNAVFEAVATEGTGVLQTLSTISKQVIRSLREQNVGADPAGIADEPPALEPEDPAPAVPDAAEGLMENAILEEEAHPEADAIAATAREAESLLDPPAWSQVAGEIERPSGVRLGPDLSIVSVGEATRQGDRCVRVPVVLGDADGQTTTVAITIQLDPLLDESE